MIVSSKYHDLIEEYIAANESHAAIVRELSNLCRQSQPLDYEKVNPLLAKMEETLFAIGTLKKNLEKVSIKS